MTDTTDKKEIKRQLKALELREKTADVAKSEIDLESAEINLSLRKLDKVRSHHQHGLLIDAHAGTFRLEDAVYAEVLSLGTSMERWAEANPGKPVTLYIFSPGGSVLHGLALYDTLRTLSSKGHLVTTVVRGYCGSMASVIFLAGDVRRLGNESLVHQHEPSAGTIGRLSDMVDTVKFVERLADKVANIYATRTELTKAQFRNRIKGKEWWCDSAEALKYGIATEVD